MIGYSVQFAQTVMAADSSKIGVQLGREAIRKGVPIVKIADALEVSRTAVYGWFTGKYAPSSRNVEALQALLNKQ